MKNEQDNNMDKLMPDPFFVDGVKMRIEKRQVPQSLIESSWRAFEQLVQQQKRTVYIRSWYYRVAAAAAIVLLVVAIRALQPDATTPSDYIAIAEEPTNTPVALVANEVRLFAGDGAIVTIKQGHCIAYKQGYLLILEQNKGQDVIAAQYPVAEKNKMNKLVVPHGRRMQLLLEDGSSLFVNSGSTVVYPSSFNSRRREIFIDGEAYFNVSAEPNRHFIVKTRKMEIAVVGTSFNVSAYPADDEHSVVLVSGEVQIRNASQPIVLTPNQRYRQTGSTTSVDVVNAVDFIAWKDGLMRVDNETLSNIFKRLERYYNVHIIYCAGKDDWQMKGSGKLYLTEDINTVLEAIKTAAPINITQQGNQYIIENNSTNPKDNGRKEITAI